MTLSPNVIEILKWAIGGGVVLLVIFAVDAWRNWNTSVATSKPELGTQRTKQIPFTDFLELASAARWNIDRDAVPIGNNGVSLLLSELRQAAFDGSLDFFGRPGDAGPRPADSAPLAPIDKSHFKTFEISPWFEPPNHEIRTLQDAYPHDKAGGFRDLHVTEMQAKVWLAGDGKPPEPASFSVRIVRPEISIAGLPCALAIEIRNIGSDAQKVACLIKIDEAIGLSGIRLPLVLRTEGQILRNGSGRFNLSKGERKIIPLFVRDMEKDPTQWWFFDEGGNGYNHQAGDMKLLIGVYGDETNGKVLCRVSSHAVPREGGGTSYAVGVGHLESKPLSFRLEQG